MTTDQASADHAHEQEHRAALHDNRAYWLGDDGDPFELIPNLCAQCVNWQPDRQLYLADGTTQHSSGFCTVRAVAELAQMPQSYAAQCEAYEEEIPF